MYFNFVRGWGEKREHIFFPPVHPPETYIPYNYINTNQDGLISVDGPLSMFAEFVVV